MPHPQHIFLKAFDDNRGRFFELYNQKNLEKKGITDSFCQDNVSFSLQKNTLRGLHFQKHPMMQSKLVIPLVGRIFDVVVDLRPESPHYLQVSTYLMDAKEPSFVYVPKGFAHGFCTLDDHVCVMYKVDNYYSAENDGGVIWNDPDLNIDWPLTTDPIISDKDARLPLLKDLPQLF